MGITKRLLLSISLFILISNYIVSQQQVLGQTYNGTREYCYSGSDLYQHTIQNCIEQDTSYNGTWYCAKMKVCETYMAKGRECIQTKGCAKATDCENIVSGEPTVSAGMTYTQYCCKNKNSFPDDDTLAVEVSEICNNGKSKYSQNFILLTLFITIITSILAASGFIY